MQRKRERKARRDGPFRIRSAIGSRKKLHSSYIVSMTIESSSILPATCAWFERHTCEIKITRRLNTISVRGDARCDRWDGRPRGPLVLKQASPSGSIERDRNRAIVERFDSFSLFDGNARTDEIPSCPDSLVRSFSRCQGLLSFL